MCPQLGFPRTDALARRLGCPPSAPGRWRHAVGSSLTDLTWRNGHTCAPLADLAHAAARLLVAHHAPAPPPNPTAAAAPTTTVPAAPAAPPPPSLYTPSAESVAAFVRGPLAERQFLRLERRELAEEGGAGGGGGGGGGAAGSRLIIDGHRDPAAFGSALEGTA